MTKQTKMILGGVAVLGLAYYLLNRGKGMKNMTGMGLEMSDFSNAVGISDFGDVIPQENFANAQGRRLCVRTNPNGSTSMYTPHGGSRCPYGGTVQNV
jgi:hypothetical protein